MSALASILLAALLPTASVRELPSDGAFGPVISCRTANGRLAQNLGTRIFFRLRGRVVGEVKSRSVTIDDGSSRAMVLLSCDDACRRGDVVTLSCTALQYVARPLLLAEALSVTAESHEDPPPPPVVSPRDLSGGRYDFLQVELVGVVTDVFRDDVDPAWLVLAVEENGSRSLVWYNGEPTEDARAARLIDARVGITGVCFPRALGMRRNLGVNVQTADLNSFRIIRPAPNEPFRTNDGPDHRQLHAGVVTAVWNERSLFLRDASGDSFEVYLAPGQVAPPPGTPVDISAFVRHNAFYTRFANALIRPRPGRHPAADGAPLDISAQDVLRTPDGRPRIDARLHGRLVRLRGKVRDGHLLGTPQAQLLLDCGGEPVSVWIGKDTPAPEPGSEIAVVGACIINVEAGTGGQDDVRLSGFSVALRRPDELTVLVHPPWWTPARFVAAIIILLVLLTAILAWNRMLRITAERRGRELLRAAIGKAEADLRTEERTRLAVELHDTIAQSLAGVTFELNTADRLTRADPAKAHQHLEIADRTLKSCRDELRNCIWDLRGHALEQKDLNDVLRQALKPHVGDARLLVRFNVPRARLTDNSLHAILRIVRELAINAVRHGQASEIRIAGSLDDEELRFSVRDDGIGFDPAAAPGVEQGHFGLQGIRERINRFGGSMEIDSRPGCGTRTTIAIRTHVGRLTKEKSDA